MQRRIDVSLEPFGMNGKVVLGYPKYREWIDMAKSLEELPPMEANIKMIKACLKEAPFPSTDESLMDLDADVIVELMAGVMKLVGPLSEKMGARSTSES